MIINYKMLMFDLGFPYVDIYPQHARLCSYSQVAVCPSKLSGNPQIELDHFCRGTCLIYMDEALDDSAFEQNMWTYIPCSNIRHGTCSLSLCALLALLCSELSLIKKTHRLEVSHEHASFGTCWPVQLHPEEYLKNLSLTDVLLGERLPHWSIDWLTDWLICWLIYWLAHWRIWNLMCSTRHPSHAVCQPLPSLVHVEETLRWLFHQPKAVST